MAETKNVFLGAKMNKDLDPRLISNREYIEARNASVTDSAGGDSGVLENVLGNIELTDFKVLNTYSSAYDTNLKIIGFYVDTTNDRLFAFITNYTDSSPTALTNPAPAASAHYIAVYNTISNDYTVLVGGSFLNFSDTHEVLGIDLIENLLFFTDNRNQPRKINVNLALANPYGSANPYYTSEDHISVAKYYPCLAPDIAKLTGDGKLFVSSELQIQTNTTLNSATISTPTFTVGTGGVTTSGSGSLTLSFSVTIVETGTGSGKYVLLPGIVLPLGGTDYQPGDTITIPGATLQSTFSSSNTPDDAVFVVTRENMLREESMYDVTSPFLPDGSTANPYYDASFTGDEQFLSDKFVRFSYRFKFEDNEYSLIAPFSQAAFIPKQDGYFQEDSIPTSILDDAANSDEVDTIKSTIIEFFENKVDKVELSIPMPDGVVLGNATNNLYDKYKVTAIDVLYKESDGTTIRVVDTITFDELETASGIDYVYTYNSSKPIKSLPSKETIRVSDRVPLRAKAQSVAGNRVMYGNLTLRGASLDSLNYSVSTGDKITFGQYGSTSQREYPNHTLKQNRTYQVGVVLSDKYGRQSDVILSPNSTVFHPYKSSVMSLDYLGDSLQVLFNAPIPSTSSNIGYVGLYDETTNPLGWYSYKLVVKQQEQSYYNVYLPTILNGYPQNVDDDTGVVVGLDNLTDSITTNQTDFNAGTYTGTVGVTGGYATSGSGTGLRISVIVPTTPGSAQTVTVVSGGTGFAAGDTITVTGSGGVLGGSTGNLVITIQASDLNTGPNSYTTVTDQSHITLFSDNINKVPRDLQEVGPQDVQFSSSVRLFGRVYNTTFNSTAATNEQYFPSNIGDEVILIGDRNEIGLDKTENGDGYYSSPFYSIPTDGIGDTVGDGSALKGANPYIGRVSTINRIGAVGGGDLTFATAPEVTNLQARLNVYETAPTFSNLDIFWESSTSGLISELNRSVAQNFSILPVQLNTFTWSLSEDNVPTTVVCVFDLANAGGQDIVGGSENATLIEVRDGNGGIVTDKFELNKTLNQPQFELKTTAGTYFKYTRFSPIKDNYTFTIQANNPELGGGTSLISTGYGNYLANVAPTGTATANDPLPEIRPPSTWGDFAVLNGSNGAAQTSDQKVGLVWEVTKVEFLWVGNGSVFTEYQTSPYDIFRIVKGSGQEIAETLQYNNQLICLDVNATNSTALYTYQNRTSTSVRVTLKLTDASGTGLTNSSSIVTTPIVLNRTD